MSTAATLTTSPELRPLVEAPVYPSTPVEFINVFAHYHRAEIGRMAGWRDRIDRTTNWAITTVAAMLSLSLSTPNAHHGVLLFAMLLIALLLMIEARRYRFFDVYRARVRRLERNYYAQILAPEAQVEEGWARILGEDLRRPLFHITLQEAMARRLRRNYGWLFVILLLAWVLKISSAKLQLGAGQSEFAYSFRDSLNNATLGPSPGWLVLVAVVCFYGVLLYAVIRPYQGAGELAYGDVHV